MGHVCPSLPIKSEEQNLCQTSCCWPICCRLTRKLADERPNLTYTLFQQLHVPELTMCDHHYPWDQAPQLPATDCTNQPDYNWYEVVEVWGGLKACVSLRGGGGRMLISPGRLGAGEGAELGGSSSPTQIHPRLHLRHTCWWLVACQHKKPGSPPLGLEQDQNRICEGSLGWRPGRAARDSAICGPLAQELQ